MHEKGKEKKKTVKNSEKEEMSNELTNGKSGSESSGEKKTVTKNKQFLLSFVDFIFAFASAVIAYTPTVTQRKETRRTRKTDAVVWNGSNVAVLSYLV